MQAIRQTLRSGLIGLVEAEFLVYSDPTKKCGILKCVGCAREETISEGNAPRNVLDAVFEILQTHFIFKEL